MYTVSSDHDKVTGEKFWYCHVKGFAYVPVFGSIGSKQKALAVCRLMNKSRKDKEDGTNTLP